jgi:hypothetical protein
MPSQLIDEVNCVSDDVFSYMCSLAMEKCSKKSEKKKASCGGAAMRKRLLIKNFVAQMLAQERQAIKDNGSGHSEDGEDSYNEDESNEECDEGMDVDEGDDQEEDCEDEEESEEYIEDDTSSPQLHLHHHATSHYGGSVVMDTRMDDVNLSMVNARSHITDLYGQHVNNGGRHMQPYFETSRSMEEWDEFHTVPGREYSILDDEEAHCGGVENHYFPMYQSYSAAASAPCSHTAYGGSITDGTTATLPDNFLDEISLTENKKEQAGSENCGPVVVDDHIASANNGGGGCAFASLVNVSSASMKFGGSCRNELSTASASSAYSRSITDLDTNTVVEEDCHHSDFLLQGTTHRSPRKRPFAQDDMYNLTTLSGIPSLLTTSPMKRIKF